MTQIIKPGLFEKEIASGLGRDNGISSNPQAAAALDASYTVDEAKAFIISKIRVYANVLRRRVLSGYPEEERAGWAIKAGEARKYALTGDDLDAPSLVMEAADRGVDLSVIVTRVTNNANAFTALEAAIAGTSGKHSDAINACATFADIAAYDWSVGWPAC